jgi:hypothetical protein
MFFRGGGLREVIRTHKSTKQSMFIQKGNYSASAQVNLSKEKKCIHASKKEQVTGFKRQHKGTNHKKKIENTVQCNMRLQTITCKRKRCHINVLHLAVLLQSSPLLNKGTTYATIIATPKPRKSN